MKRVAAALAISGLVAIAAYTVLVVVVAVSEGKGHGSVFWSAIALLVVIACGALWLAKRVVPLLHSSRT